MNDLAPPLKRRTSGAARGRGPRIDAQPGFVLHSYPWRESSLIIEVFTHGHGRVALVARGAKRPTSQFRGLLSSFSPLLLSWSGRNDIKTLVRADWTGGLPLLRGDALLAAFYLNELLVRLLARGDAHEQLFASYLEALRALATDGTDHESTLRGFELDLLRETGHAPSFDVCADGAPVEAAGLYRVEATRGLERVESADGDIVVDGDTALAIARRDFSAPQVATAGKSVLRHLLRVQLNGQPLNTRRILRDLREL